MGARVPSGTMASGWQIEAYGRSVRGAELRVHLPPRPRHLLVAGLHGEEPETVQLARGIVDRVSAADASCAIVLCANPDGVADGTRQNARGVDLNRNFPAVSWRGGTTPSYRPASTRQNACPPTARTSHRPAARRSPSRRAPGLAALIERLEPALVLDLHAPLELVLTTPLCPRTSRASWRARPGSSSPTSSARRFPGRCATGSATMASPVSPTRWSTPDCLRSTGGTCRGSWRSRECA